MRIDFVGPRKWFFIFSGVLVAASLILLAIPPALRPGIEFTSGTTSLIRFERPVDQATLRQAYADLGHPEVRIQSTGENEYLIRTGELEIPEGAFSEVAPEPEVQQPDVGPQPLEPLATLRLGAEDADGDVTLYAPQDGNVCVEGDEGASVPAGTEASVVAIHAECGAAENVVYRVLVDDDTLGYIVAGDTHDFQEIAPDVDTEEPIPDQGERTVIENELRERFGEFEVLEFSSVSPVVSQVAVRNATIAIAVASLFIMGYVAFAFASLPRPFRYGVCTLVALLHDAIIVLGAFSLFGKLFGMEVNLMFVTGLLTVIGFSVHDTIVTFDRLREIIRANPHAPFADSVNAALVQTLARSMATSATLLLTVGALLTLGGVTLQPFLLVILVGVIAGTYSSIGIAAQLLVAWEEGDFARLKARLRRRSEVPTRA